MIRSGRHRVDLVSVDAERGRVAAASLTDGLRANRSAVSNQLRARSPARASASEIARAVETCSECPTRSTGLPLLARRHLAVVMDGQSRLVVHRQQLQRCHGSAPGGSDEEFLGGLDSGDKFGVDLGQLTVSRLG